MALRRMELLAMSLLYGALMAAAPAFAQDKGTVNPKPLPPLANPNDPATPAKQLFGRAASAANLEARSFGHYAKGCLAGGRALPVDGDAWQVMRLSRNRNWAHPAFLRVLERIARKGKSDGVWPGLLVGDLAQPRGGPMLTGHASHQIGLDGDVWLTPMPARTLSRLEREETSAIDMLRRDKKDVDPKIWSDNHLAIIKIAAQQPEVERIFVNAGIKKALCRYHGRDRSWLSKVRPMWGHNYHFHIRISCPSSEASCEPQSPPAAGDGCGRELDWWFTDAVLNPKPPKTPPKPKPPMTLAELPNECRMVLNAK